MEAPWDEAVFRDLRGDREEKQLLEELAKECGWLFRTVARDTAYAVKTVGSFSDYLRALGSSTRLRLYNRRKVLESCGDIRVTNAWPDQVDDFFERLNRFHSKRWGQPCFNEASVRFHKAFLERVGKEGGVPKLSELTCDGEVISQLYNVEYLGCLYNIQSGFVEGFHKKIALGTLHIGYSLEEAFESRDVNVFDMLAGQGKNENYKARMATCSQTLESVMLVQSPVLKFLYGLKEFLAKRHRLIG
ncbi:MAG: GNAT family N-acetyltransferase [Marinobacter sp.]|nr:GNAT family N-acetyltransferase [Marinobacter sp.]